MEVVKFKKKIVKEALKLKQKMNNYEMYEEV